VVYACVAVQVVKDELVEQGDCWWDSNQSGVRKPAIGEEIGIEHHELLQQPHLSEVEQLLDRHFACPLRERGVGAAEVLADGAFLAKLSADGFLLSVVVRSEDGADAQVVERVHKIGKR